MDQIYSSAYITIVAAAGQDVHAGLPGVSRFHRRQLQEAHIGDIHFVQLPRPGLATIMSSHWASRGWTFQECYLSGRRLIFTEDQTLFLCNKSFVAESVRPQICTAGPLSLQFGHLIRRPKWSGNTYGQLLEQVQEYSRRNISCDRDSLNAFLGVLHQWETRLAWTNEPISHLWGLPIKGTTTHGPDSVEIYVLWSHTRHDAVRRPDFPSWSWAGWAGRKDFSKYPIHLDGTEQEQNQFRVCISVQSDDQETQKLAIFHKDSVVRTQKSQIHQPGPTRLLVTCAVFPIKFRNFQLSQDQRDEETELRLDDNRTMITRPKHDNLFLFRVFGNIQVGIPGKLDQHVQPNEHLSGLLLSDTLISGHFLVVKQVGEGLYERVGLCCWYHIDCEKLFLNEEGCILDRVTLPGTKLFPAEFERRTMCLV